METRSNTIKGGPLTAICAGLLLAVLPLVDKVAPWAAAIFAGALLGRWLVNRRHLKLPGLPLKLLVLAAGFGGIALSYGSMLGVEPGLGILLILVSLKVLETNTERDVQVITLLGWFLSLCGLFFSQNLSMWLYIGAVCGILTAGLVSFHLRAAGGSFWRSLRISGVMALQAAPIILLLFLFFPRSYGGFRFSFGRSITGSTGMSNRLEPGSFANLALNHDVAFRVDFPRGNVPSPAQMYWRGGVLWRGDGLRWVQGRRDDMPVENVSGKLEGPIIVQGITMEPHGEKWLFALDRPVGEVPGTTFTAGGALQSTRTIMTRRRFEVISRPENRERNLYREQRDAALQLPARISPRVRELVASWRAAGQGDSSAASSENASAAKRGGKDWELVEQALRWLRRENFRYTLSPGTYGGDELDDFLFRRKEGFCEHYAASFATLMRVAGIPARLVIGYHGGEFNPMGKYVIVRQSDAHAWTDVWIAGTGWIRVDPTEVIAPDRIGSGFESFLQSRSGPSASGGDERSSGFVGMREIMREARLAWDNVNYQWDLRVLNFDEDTQRSFFASLGFESYTWPALLTWIAVGMTLFLGVLGLLLRRPALAARDPVQRAYARFCRILARAGLPRAPSEGPVAYAGRAVERFPEAAEPIQQVRDVYIRLRYSPQPGLPGDLVRAVRQVPKLRASRSPATSKTAQANSSWDKTLKQ